MISDELRFCFDETKTKLCLGYHTSTGELSVRMKCHPSWVVIKALSSVQCGYCSEFDNSKIIGEAIGIWKIVWQVKNNASAKGVIQNWASGWTGIPEAELEVTVTTSE